MRGGDGAKLRSVGIVDGVHDMGAMHGFGPIPVGDVGHGPSWGARLQAVAILSGGIRRGDLEALPPELYLTSGYHERWLRCAEARLVRRGRVGEAALSRWRDALHDPDVAPPRRDDPEATEGLLATLTTTPSLHRAEDARFGVGDRVRVRRMRPERHHRCPRYVRGAVGTVERVVGSDFLPDIGRRDGELEPVYTVCFSSHELWGDGGVERGRAHDVLIDLWQSYLEAP